MLKFAYKLLVNDKANFTALLVDTHSRSLG
jgi:hypothetical protein